jgi:hypothetical protein
VATTIVLGVSLTAWAAPAGASRHTASAPPTPVVPGITLVGCTGAGIVYDSSGQVLDNATAPGGGGASVDNPIIVDPGGKVVYHGQSAAVITHHHWSIVFDGQEVKSGGSANDGRETTHAGTEQVSSYIPSYIITGTFYLNGFIEGDGGARCDGAAWVKLNGNPATTAAFYLMLVLFILALLFFFLGMPDMAEDLIDQGEDIYDSISGPRP